MKRIRSVRAALQMIVLALVAVIAPACQGTHHQEDVSRSDFENGTAKHPAAYNALYDELRDCMNKQFSGVAQSTVPLDSVVRAWHIVDNADDLIKVCPRADGHTAAGECWSTATQTIALARPALNTWTLPVHAMGHAWQFAARMPENADPGGTGAQAAVHGPKFNHCVNREG